MATGQLNIDALVRDLSDFQKEIEVGELLGSAIAGPPPTADRLGQIEQVLETFQSLDPLVKDDAQALVQLITIGRTYEQLSHLKKAYETYEKALTLAERRKDTGSRAVLLNRIGRVLSRWDRWEEAVPPIQKSLEAYRELGDAQGQARALMSLGIVYQEQGNYPASEEAYRKAHEMARGAKDRRTVANALNGLAVLATIRGDFGDAVARYQESLDLCRETGNRVGMARAYHNLGMAHADRKDWPSAMESFEKGFEEAQAEGLLDVMANIHLSRAELLLELGDGSMVALCCARALDIFKKIEDRLGEADTYRVLGRLFTLRRQWATAGSLFRDSLRLNEEYGKPLNVAEAQRDLSRMHAARGHRSEAKAGFGAALSSFERLGAMGDAAEIRQLIAALDAS